MKSLDDRFLTAIEIAILHHIAAGYQSKEIATMINRSKPTVESYVRLLAAKFGARSRAHLIVICLREGVLHLDAVGGQEAS